MKYNGPITDGSLHKGKLCPKFKYLAHVMLHVFGSMSGGYDVMRKSIRALMVALILNKPFNVSGMILEHMLEPLRGLKNKKFLLYPRFIQMILVVQDHMNLNTLVRMKGYKGVPLNERPPHKNLVTPQENPTSAVARRD